MILGIRQGGRGYVPTGGPFDRIWGDDGFVLDGNYDREPAPILVNIYLVGIAEIPLHT